MFLLAIPAFLLLGCVELLICVFFPLAESLLFPPPLPVGILIPKYEFNSASQPPRQTDSILEGIKGGRFPGFTLISNFFQPHLEQESSSDLMAMLTVKSGSQTTALHSGYPSQPMKNPLLSFLVFRLISNLPQETQRVTGSNR